MSSDAAQKIKEKLDVVEFLRGYLELKSAGKNFKACCPFHREKTPSFMISPERQTWHCFGSCGEGGDIIKFLMKYENIEFYDALKILADKAGVVLKEFSSRDFKSYNNLYVLMNEAKDFYKSNLFQSRKVLDYVKERGLAEKTVREFELGLAPDGSDILVRHLLDKGYKIEDIEKVGLALKTERGTYWDRFRSRLVFPIFNHVGKTVAFTGRVLPWNNNFNTGKYVNSPETPIFQKSKILYGFHSTKNDIRDAKTAVVVEGQMDFLMIWQDGVRNAVATSGTAMTKDHIVVLHRFADELVLSFDSDEAGQAAAERAIDLANANDATVKLLVIEDSKLKDPADVVKSKPGEIAKMLKNTKSAMDYYFHKYIKDMPSDARIRKNNIRTVLLKIRNFSSAIDRSHWIKHLSSLVEVDETALNEEMAALPSAAVVKASPFLQEAAVEEEGFSRKDLIVQRLLGIFLYKNNLDGLNGLLKYFPKKYVDIYDGLNVGGKNNIPENLSELVDTINLRFSFENQNLDDDRLNKEIKMLEKEIKVEFYRGKMQEIGEIIKKLEKSGDEENLKKATAEFDAMSKELHNIKTNI